MLALLHLQYKHPWETSYFVGDRSNKHASSAWAKYLIRYSTTLEQRPRSNSAIQLKLDNLNYGRT